MQADGDDFLVACELRAYEGTAAAHAGAWSFRIPRDHV